MPASLENHHDKGRQGSRATENNGAQLPRQLTFPGAGKDPLHGAEDVKRRDNVDDFEAAVP